METEEFKHLPESIQSLLRYGIRLVNPRKVILFGSRARGDHRENSDYDVVFKSLRTPEAWTNFMVDSDERAFTLLKVDLLNYEKCPLDYKQNIDSEGKLLYEI
jgi:predicted nucleotidyltransferase